MSFRQRLQFWANQKGAWTHILMGAGIALLIVIILMASCVPSKGLVNRNADGISEVQGKVDTAINGLGNKASTAALDAFKEDVNDTIGDQAADISDHDERLGIAEVKLAQARTDITAIQGQIDSVLNSPLSATLVGTFGNYTLSVKSDEAGNFTVKVHLVYEPATGSAANQTAVVDSFYAGVNWSLNATLPQYVVVPTYDGTTWGITEVWWNVGVIEIAADTEVALNITCAGLDAAWEPDYAYVEVYPAW